MLKKGERCLPRSISILGWSLEKTKTNLFVFSRKYASVNFVSIEEDAYSPRTVFMGVSLIPLDFEVGILFFDSFFFFMIALLLL